MKLEQTKTREEFLQALKEEEEAKNWEEIKRMSRSIKSQVRNMARIEASHSFGEGECNCSNCEQN